MPGGIPARLPSIGPSAGRSSGAAPAAPTREAPRTQTSRTGRPPSEPGPTTLSAPDPSSRSGQGDIRAGEGVVSGVAAQALLERVRGEPTEALRAASAGLGPESTRALDDADDEPVRLAQLQITSETLGGMDTTRMRTAVSRLAGNATVSLRSLLAAKAEETGESVPTTVQTPEPDGDSS